MTTKLLDVPEFIEWRGMHLKRVGRGPHTAKFSAPNDCEEGVCAQVFARLQDGSVMFAGNVWVRPLMAQAEVDAADPISALEAARQQILDAAELLKGLGE